ncbi:MAG TPA: M28 family peptidase, partial [Bacteroidales bacterium]|nr:M28 family peptidase [Bacteroidales bacterium]
MNKIFLYAIILFIVVSCKNTNINKLSDEEIINKIFITAEEGQESYKDLKYLTDNFPKRLACYPQSIEAAKWAKTIMGQLNLDTTFLQEARVMNWERGDIEIGEIRINNQVIPVNVCVLGRGISTGEEGIEGRLIEVKSLEDFNQIPQDKIKGKIVFFNQAMNPELKNTFQAYGEAAGQRFMGPIMAAEKGAIGAVIRSLTTSVDTFPHTGTTRKPENEPTVPAVSIATKHANLLSDLIEQNPDLKFFFKTNCINKPDTITYNAIGELKGIEFPNEYIIVGGHLDSWDNSPGAHDDGGGCMQSIEVLRIFKKIGYKPKHSIRAVMYMDEEI